MAPPLDKARVRRAWEQVRSALVDQITPAGHWEGKLSNSALSTATAVMALETVRRAAVGGEASDADRRLPTLIADGIRWLASHQNADGGWGDTDRSISNISTTMLSHAVLCATAEGRTHPATIAAAKVYIDRAGGVSALRARYGKDKTFSIPILTHCALAGLVDWKEIAPLPFELACLPSQFYKWVRLPVVSYALPALIAIGQVRHHFVRPWNPLTRWMRNAAIDRSLEVLERIQPPGGGFLEATPLTSFVTMSLAGMGLHGQTVAKRGVEFILRSVQPDGSWPIDTNLATWVTTLSIGALGGELPAEVAGPVRRWLLDQQYRSVHPYTNADPGGWAWTDLDGGVPDADDTPGAMLALMAIGEPDDEEDFDALARAVSWLLGLQNRDGGWPTFCRGWGALPFDRSAPDITAHVLRALHRWMGWRAGSSASSAGISVNVVRASIERGFRYLQRAQRADGSWLPLWFGNQFAPDDENPTYGTARVLAAYRDTGRLEYPEARRGLEWLRRTQNPDGGWGAGTGTSSTVEESALAAEILLSLEADSSHLSESSLRALEWLLGCIERGDWTEPSPIGFYFAKLWYYERLYPVIFTVGALRRAGELFG